MEKSFTSFVDQARGSATYGNPTVTRTKTWTRGSFYSRAIQWENEGTYITAHMSSSSSSSWSSLDTKANLFWLFATGNQSEEDNFTAFYKPMGADLRWVFSRVAYFRWFTVGPIDHTTTNMMPDGTIEHDFGILLSSPWARILVAVVLMR